MQEPAHAHMPAQAQSPDPHALSFADPYPHRQRPILSPAFNLTTSRAGYAAPPFPSHSPYPSSTHLSDWSTTPHQQPRPAHPAQPAYYGSALGFVPSTTGHYASNNLYEQRERWSVPDNSQPPVNVSSYRARLGGTHRLSEPAVQAAHAEQPITPDQHSFTFAQREMPVQIP